MRKFVDWGLVFLERYAVPILIILALLLVISYFLFLVFYYDDAIRLLNDALWLYIDTLREELGLVALK